MSSKYLEKVWSHKTVTMEEKLLLLALAELADRHGAFITSMQELSQMTSGSESALENLLSKLSLNHHIIGLNKRGNSYRDGGNIKGKLNVDTYVDHGASQQQANEQPAQFEQAFQKRSKMSSFHRSQVSPIQPSGNNKMINAKELSPNVIEDWAELIMFKSGFAGQTAVWASFIEKLRLTPQALFNMDEMTSRLHSHLHSEKTPYQSTRKSSNYQKGQYQKAPRRSAVDELEEKISNFKFNDE
ncbi:hypothetical protein [Vibrio ulleungensis]|uniref:Uncharacterized protein n=1 Tax=Vibrio ulleungensis TaxID=2807619 RepID=A0ABS2HND6_9VIBR|nr:hypothetical protein [Vibrio ulleungensis]MBM7038569.1 hypothetical protein [Vibrio ulleungensis]